jgi:hypothetical protein
MKKIIPMVSLTFLVACGQTSSHKKSSELKVVETSNLTSSPTLMKKQNKNCATKSFNHAATDLHMLFQGKMEIGARNIMSLLTGNILKSSDSSVISESNYGLALEVTVKDGVAGKMVQVSGGDDLEVCDEEVGFDRGTFESAGLNAGYFISKTNSKIKSILPSVSIRPIALVVGPVIKTVVQTTKGSVIEQQTLYQTDNAYYQPGADMIVILPHSQAMKEKQDASYWEVPMVASHEYGHHIFSTLAPNVFIEDAAMGMCFGHQHRKNTAVDETAASTPRTVTNFDILMGFNEGFADLMAFYTLSEQERGLKGVIGLETAREVDSGVFPSGNKKAFSDFALYAYFYPIKAWTEDGLQDGHTLGAIFAHGVETFMNSQGATNDQKLEATLTWLQNVNEKHTEMKKLEPKAYLKQLVVMFIENAMTKLGKTQDAASCAQLETIYPTMSASVSGCAPAPTAPSVTTI